MNPHPWGEKPGDVIQLHEALSTEPLKDTLTKAPGLEFSKCCSQKATKQAGHWTQSPGCAGLQFTTPEIRFHKVPAKCPEHRAGVCLLLSRSQLWTNQGTAETLRACSHSGAGRGLAVPAVAFPRSWEGHAAGEPLLGLRNAACAESS